MAVFYKQFLLLIYIYIYIYIYTYRRYIYKYIHSSSYTLLPFSIMRILLTILGN